jgi:hypothetical protein
VGIQAVLEVEAWYEGAPSIPTGRPLRAGTNLRSGNRFRRGWRSIYTYYCCVESPVHRLKPAASIAPPHPRVFVCRP